MTRIGALAGAAALVVWAVVGMVTVGPASVGVAFADVLRPVVQATGEVRAVHMVLHMLTRDGEDFGYVNLDGGTLRPVEVWLEAPGVAGDHGRARIEKADRAFTFDGDESILYLQRSREAYRSVGFDSDLFWPAAWVRHLQHLPAEGVDVLDYAEQDGQGRLLLRARGVAMKPLEPAFFGQFDRETEIVWNLDTDRLQELRLWVDHHGERRLFCELLTIDYLPSLDDALFRPDLPADVRWGGVADSPLPADQIGLGPRAVAQRIFDASIERDRKTLELYVPSPALVDWFLTHSIEVVALGEPFRAGDYPGVYVPYRVEVGWHGVLRYTKEHNVALRDDNPRGRWQLDGGW